MSNSSLYRMVKLSPSITSPRRFPITRITIHCYVGMATVESMLEFFSNPDNKVSCNYVVDMNGKIGLVADEGDRSWCSSSSDNDNRAITIEVASEKTSPYEISKLSYDSVVELCIDVCKRNGKKKLIWFGDKNTSLSYLPKQDEMIITVHRWFANKSCPGDYIYKRLGTISSIVTARLGESDEPEIISNEMKWAIDVGLFIGGTDGKHHPTEALTREQAAILFKRYTEKFIK